LWNWPCGQQFRPQESKGSRSAQRNALRQQTQRCTGLLRGQSFRFAEWPAPRVARLAPYLAAAPRAVGLSVTTGTVSNPALLDRVLRFGPDAVTGDAPHALRRGVRSRAA
jgi:hypothetical protein